MSTKRLRALEEKIGDGDEFIEQLKRIALGKSIEVQSDIPGVIKTLTPTISEMHAACIDILDRRYGRPRQAVEITPAMPEKWTPERLSLQELEEMDRLARKGLPENVVDATFTTQEDK